MESKLSDHPENICNDDNYNILYWIHKLLEFAYDYKFI